MFYPLYPKVLQALKSFPNFVGVFRQWSRLVWLFLDSCRSVCLYVSVDLSVWRGMGHPRQLLAQDVQVDWRSFSHGEQDLLNVLNVQSLLRFPLPAAKHDVVHFLRTNPRPLQNPALSYTLNNLIVTQLKPRLLPIGKDLPQDDSKAPDITFRGELPVHNALWGHPANR